jgi:mono/diheme cytochrome c family protein
MRISNESPLHLSVRRRARSRRATVIAVALMTLAAGRLFSADTPEEWKAPPRAQKKPNPVPSDADSIAAGKKIYAGNCLACHGAGGKGDGPAAAALNPKPHDLSDPKIAAQSDGELFWKVTEGRKPMPAYEKLLSDTQRWQVINYLRDLEKKSGGGK